MNELLQGKKCEIAFSRRFTIHQIWAQLDKKYPAVQNSMMKREYKKSV